MVVSVYIHIYIYIYTNYIKTTAFQTSPVEKERNKGLNFTFQASNSTFQAETRIKISKLGDMISAILKNCHFILCKKIEWFS